MLPPARDQGARSTCLSFAASAAHAVLRCQGSDLVLLSEEMIHQGAKRVGGHKSGVSIPSLAKTLETDGQCSLSLFPYEDQELVKSPSALAATDGATRKGKLSTKGASMPILQTLLDAGQPVILVLRLCQAFFLTPDGIIETPDSNDIIQGLHAVVATGIVSVHGRSGDFIEFRNSWGTDWGANGYGFIEPSYVESYALSLATIKPS